MIVITAVWWNDCYYCRMMKWLYVWLYVYVCPTHRYVCPTHRYVCPTHWYVCPTHWYVCSTHWYVCPTHWYDNLELLAGSIKSQLIFHCSRTMYGFYSLKVLANIDPHVECYFYHIFFQMHLLFFKCNCSVFKHWAVHFRIVSLLLIKVRIAVVIRIVILTGIVFSN